MLDRYDSVEFERVTYQAETGGLSCPEAVTRLHYYDISSLPTLIFGGTTEIVGAGDEAIDGGAYDPLDAGDAPSAPLVLLGNAPNPFNPRTVIRYRLARPAAVTLGVYDLQGRRVRRIEIGRRTAGEHGIAWDGRDDAGRALPAGAYVYRLNGSAEVASGKMSLVR